MTSKIITTAAGVVEIAVEGSGPPILVLHGSPGGIDGAIAMSRFLERNKFRIICLSRPGYLDTPLNPEKALIDDEADLVAAVLDTLDIDRVGILAWSGGGGAAYRFAVRHPSRVSSIVAIAAVSSRWVVPIPSISQRLMFGTTIGQRLVTFLSKQAPRHVIGEALKGEGSIRGKRLTTLIDQAIANPEQSRLILDIAQTVNTNGKRQSGWQNDITNFARIDSLELERVECPVLLIHGEGDTDAIPEYSRSAHRKLPNSVLVEMEDGTHLSFYVHPEASDVQEKARRWFHDHAQKAQD